MREHHISLDWSGCQQDWHREQLAGACTLFFNCFVFAAVDSLKPIDLLKGFMPGRCVDISDRPKAVLFLPLALDMRASEARKKNELLLPSISCSITASFP